MAGHVVANRREVSPDRRKGLFGYESPPELPNMCRDVFKWVHRLDLSYALRSPRRDCANGFLIAELLSRYFPKDINMRTYENGLSSHFRNDNWMQIQDACRKHGFQLPGELVSGVMREQHGSAVQLLELLYEHLTGKKLLRAAWLLCNEEDVTALYERMSDQQAQVEEDEELQRMSMESAANAKTSQPERLPGTEGAFAISAIGTLPEPLKFGAVEVRNVGDAAKIREQFAKQR